jgi:phosphatidylglycerol---prolipoprotein diacylglyceryl transferase
MLYLDYPVWIKPEIIPGFPLLRWYGFMYLVSFAVAYWLIVRQNKQRKAPYDSDTIASYFFWVIIGLIVGARVFAAFVYDTTGRYLTQPWLVFWPFDESGAFSGLQGMSYHGGLIGVIIATAIFCKSRKIPFMEWGDTVVAAAPLGYTFGRIGNFLNGELFGRVTSSPLGMVFPNAQAFPVSEDWVREVARKAGMAIPDSATLINLPRFPSQLFEAFFEGIVLWAVIYLILRKKKPFDGFLIGCYAIGYGVFRFFIEYFREPDVGIGYPIRFAPGDTPTYLFSSPWNFTTGQILCFVMMAGGGAYIWYAARRSRGNGAAAGMPPPGTGKSDPVSAKRNAARRERKKLR